MSDARTLRPGLTVRLSQDMLDRERRIAEAEHRSAAAYLEQLVERDLAARDEAERVVRVFVDPALAGAAEGAVVREADEDEARHARRAATLDRLFGGGDRRSARRLRPTRPSPRAPSSGPTSPSARRSIGRTSLGRCRTSPMCWATG